jgi:L-seryl-tRNA(Ser) seleniumtransferase
MSDPSIESALRSLPAVGRLAEHIDLSEWTTQHGHSAVVAAARKTIDKARQAILNQGGSPSLDALVLEVQTLLKTPPRPFQKVINATGVLLHTNLGRSPIADAAWNAMAQARDYCDLEFDLENGKRGSRMRGVSNPLAELTGAEAGMVVNNCAAALLLMVTGLAGNKPTAISRGQIVEIGGGFRLPKMMEASGSQLMEIGTTNRTHLYDYEEAAKEGAGLLLCLHRSNFKVEGFVTEPKLEEIIALGKQHDVPVVMDLGSGCMVDTTKYGLPSETTVQAIVKLGFDVVAFSGDKLLGGPQAGFLVGSKDIIAKLQKHPLARALRCDKMQLAAAIATLELYLRGEAEQSIPLLRSLNQTPSQLRDRCLAWQNILKTGEIIETPDAAGGGTLPGGELPGIALSLEVQSPDTMLAKMRAAHPPIIGHIVEDRVLIHPRSVHLDDDALLAQSILEILTSKP